MRGTWRADGMNATVCASCHGTADMPGDMYTTVTVADRNVETEGATNSTQCRRKYIVFVDIKIASLYAWKYLTT